MPKLQLDGIEADFSRCEESDRAVILVHGGMDRMQSMRRVAKHLSDSVNVLRYDRRGYAGSLTSGGSRTMRQNIDDLVAFIDYLTLVYAIESRNIVLFGHSMGGVVAIGGAIQREVKSTVVYESPIVWLKEAVRLTANEEILRTDIDSRVFAEQFMIKMVGHNVWQRLPEKIKEARRAEGDTLLSEMRDVRTAIPWGIEQVRTPLVVAHGTESLPHQIANAQTLAKLISGSMLVTIEGANHGAHLSHAKEVVDKLIRPQIFSD